MAELSEPASDQPIKAFRDAYEAIGRLLEVNRPYLLEIANQEIDPAIGPKVGGASNVVDGAILKALEKFPAFRGTTEVELRNWLRTILRRHLLDLSAKAQPEKDALPLDSSLVATSTRSPSSEVARQEQGDPEQIKEQQIEAKRRALVAAVKTLEADDRLVFLLRSRPERPVPYEEIGEYLNCSGDAARHRFNRIVDRLKQDPGIKLLMELTV